MVPSLWSSGVRLRPMMMRQAANTGVVRMMKTFLPIMVAVVGGADQHVYGYADRVVAFAGRA